MSHKLEKLIEEIRKRHFEIKRRIMRLDQENGIAYVLCEEAGIDTTGMRPRDCWEALEKKTGKGISYWYQEAKDRETRYKEKEFKQKDIDRLKNRDYVMYDGEMYEYSESDGEFRSLFSDKKISKDEMNGKTASLIYGDRGSVSEGQDFKPHKMDENELDELGVEDLVIYRGKAYVNCFGKFVNISDMEDEKNPRAFMVNDVVVVKRDSSKNEDKTWVYGEKDDGEVSYRDSNGKHEVGFSDESHSRERVESVEKEYDSKTIADVDDMLREHASKVWDKLADEQQDLVKEYTGDDSDKYNAACRGNMDMEEAKESIPEIIGMTNAVRRSKMPRDIMLYRGVDQWGASDIFGDDIFEEGFDLESLIGRELTDEGFMSTTSLSNKNREKGQECEFLNKSLVFEIFTPKGTEALYVAPVSRSGDNKRDYSSPLKNANEMETIVQRGTTMKVTGVEKRGNQIVVKTSIIGQKYRNLPTMPR